MARQFIQLKGAKELDRLLKQLDKKVAKQILRKALRAGAKPIQQQAKENAPKDSGQLAKSIKVRAGKRTRNGGISVVVSTSKGDFKGDEFYGSFWEYGYKKLPVFRNADGRFSTLSKAQRKWAKQNTTPIAPRPFMRPAFDARKDEAVRIVTDEILRGITRVTSGHSSAGGTESAGSTERPGGGPRRDPKTGRFM